MTWAEQRGQFGWVARREGWGAGSGQKRRCHGTTEMARAFVTGTAWGGVTVEAAMALSVLLVLVLDVRIFTLFYSLFVLFLDVATSLYLKK